MVDKVYDDSMQRYNQALYTGEEVVRTNLDYIASRADTSGEGVPIAVFNTLGWTRTDVATVDVSFSQPGVRIFALRDPGGQAVPIQISNELRNDVEGIRQARITFLARNIPAMGYAVYHAVPNAAGPANALPMSSHRSSHEDSAAIENEFYRASFNLWTGEMTSLVLKENNWEVLADPAMS